MTWVDWLRKFFNEPGTAIVMFMSGVLGFMIGIANGVVQKRHGGWPAFFGSIATGTVIATIVGLAIFDYVKSEAMRYAIVGFCAVISDDIWAGFQTLGGSFRANPLDTLFRVLDAIRGRPAGLQGLNVNEPPDYPRPPAPPIPPTDPTPTPKGD